MGLEPEPLGLGPDPETDPEPVLAFQVVQDMGRVQRRAGEVGAESLPARPALPVFQVDPILRAWVGDAARGRRPRLDVAPREPAAAADRRRQDGVQEHFKQSPDAHRFRLCLLYYFPRSVYGTIVKCQATSGAGLSRLRPSPRR